MKCFILCVWIFISCDMICGLIVPDEVPSLLSLIYSNIPVIKKGTDSRLGWGFRLGDRADFQFLVELGPQLNTEPLANQGDNASSASKRNSQEKLIDYLYAQRQREKQEQDVLKDGGKSEQNKSKTEGQEYLENWREVLKSNVQRKPIKPLHAEPTRISSQKAKPVRTKTEAKSVNVPLGIGELDAKKVLPDDAELMLAELQRQRALAKLLNLIKQVNTTTMMPSVETSSVGVNLE